MTNDWEKEKERARALCTYSGGVYHTLHYYGKIDLTSGDWIGFSNSLGRKPNDQFRLIEMRVGEGFTIQLSKNQTLQFILENLATNKQRRVIVTNGRQTIIYTM